MEFHQPFTCTSIFFVHKHSLLWPPTPPSSIWAIFSSYCPSAITYPPIPIQQLHFSSNFIDFSPIFRFSRTHAPNLVITTHLGLPSPSTIDWPNIPPTRWPQCHSLLLSPLFYQFLLISHPIRPSVRLSVCTSFRHISAHPSIHLTHPPTYPPTPSRLHPSV